MGIEHRSWQDWEKFFVDRSYRPLPALEQDLDYSALPKSLARSLAIFQLGESGGGTIVAQSFCNSLPGLNEHYGTSVAYFVEEEHRHANILAMCVRLLGGTLIRSNWTARLFVFARRLIGLRLKVVVLLAAEVVGLCYYHLLAVVFSLRFLTNPDPYSVAQASLCSYLAFGDGLGRTCCCFGPSSRDSRPWHWDKTGAWSLEIL